MLQFRLTQKVRQLFAFTDEMLSEPVAGDAFLGNWYADIIRIEQWDALLFMSEKTLLSFVLLDVRADHADKMANGFVNGLEHMLQEEKFAERSIRRIFEGVDVMEITAVTDEGIASRMQRTGQQYGALAAQAATLSNWDILDVMKEVNRTANEMLEGVSPLKATKRLLRNSDIELH
ncbi:MAG: hypothetical protein JXR76_08475 [Deltaproteobacteria bacterium]|nr:hypothetical protein [Deltaproteobacteria bacterium]